MATQLEMPTNNNADNQPEFDCAGKAEREGQPSPFVLIASDPLAPWLVEVWAAMSRGDVPTALGNFYGMVDTNVNRYLSDPRKPEKLDNAERIAMDMRNWRISKGLR